MDAKEKKDSPQRHRDHGARFTGQVFRSLWVLCAVVVNYSRPFVPCPTKPRLCVAVLLARWRGRIHSDYRPSSASIRVHLRFAFSSCSLCLCGEFRSDCSDIEHHNVSVSGLIDQVLNGLRTEQFAELFSGCHHQRAKRAKGGLSAGTSLGILVEGARQRSNGAIH